jgi:hypothetical protein
MALLDRKKTVQSASHLNLFNSKLPYTHISINHAYIQQTKYAVVESITHASNALWGRRTMQGSHVVLSRILGTGVDEAANELYRDGRFPVNSLNDWGHFGPVLVGKQPKLGKHLGRCFRPPSSFRG